jgi:hypothetical protein
MYVLNEKWDCTTVFPCCLYRRLTWMYVLGLWCTCLFQHLSHPALLQSMAVHGVVVSQLNIPLNLQSVGCSFSTRSKTARKSFPANCPDDKHKCRNYRWRLLVLVRPLVACEARFVRLWWFKGLWCRNCTPRWTNNLSDVCSQREMRLHGRVCEDDLHDCGY